MYRLVFLTGKMKGRRVAVQQGTVVIGRDPMCQIDLVDDERVSHKHAQIELRRDGIYIKDLGALNPVEVNGKQASEAKLNHRDKITIGSTQMEFQIVQPYVHGGRRRISRVQVITFAAIGVILALEVVFVLLFSSWQEEDLSLEAVRSPEPATGAVAQATSFAVPETELRNAPSSAPTGSSTTVEQTVAATAAETRVSDEVAELREAVADLRNKITNVVAAPPAVTVASSTPTGIVEQAVTSTTATPETVATSTPPSEPVVDPLWQKAKEMLKQAQDEIARHELAQADQTLERIQVMSPDFIASYIERARLNESRGMLKKAGEQWSAVMDRSLGTPLYQQAATERQRLARAELTRSTAQGPTNAGGGAASARLPRRIRIASVEREKFQASKDYDEMRLLRIALKPKLSEGHIEADEVGVVVTFYDRVFGTDRVVPTGATVPTDRLRVEEPWAAGEQKTVTAAYILAKGFRAAELAKLGEQRNYEGYRVQLYYKNELQDEDAMPRSLLALKVPPPSASSEANKPMSR